MYSEEIDSVRCTTNAGSNPVLTTMKPLTREQLIKNGTCCGLKCMNCPYIPKAVKGNKNLK